jgi:hypothetical protein
MATAPVISEPTADRFSSSAPTKPESGVRVKATPADYETQVRATLIQLGAGDPDGQINATRRFLEGCQDAGIDASVCAASIYSTVKHQHHGGTILREAGVAAENGAEEKSVGRWTEVWFEDPAEAAAYAPLLEKVNSTIVADAQNRIVTTNASGSDIRRVLTKMRPKGEVTLYPNVDKAPLAAENGAASPTREEWEVVVRRGGNSEDEVTAAAGRRPTQVTAGNAVFAGFNDDEKAQKFAQKMTQKGYVTSSGPSRESNLHEAREAAPVIHEEVCETCIPWIKVTRDPHKHAEHMKLAQRHGPIKTPRQVYALVGTDLMREKSEIFLVIPLNVRGELCCPPYEVARGQASRVHVEAADVIRAALDAGAEGYICCHSHPSGKSKPSKADIELTNMLKSATKPYGKSLCLLDHVVIGNGECFSIFENKLYKVK